MALRLETEPEWIAFITEAGVPPEPATQYAKTFTENRIRVAGLQHGLTKISRNHSHWGHSVDCSTCEVATEIKVKGAAPAKPTFKL